MKPILKPPGGSYSILPEVVFMEKLILKPPGGS